MIIGIGGVSRSGKSFLASQINEKLFNDQAKIINQDFFVKPVSQIPKINQCADWEHPDSIDFRSFYHGVENASKSNKTIIVEGFLVFAKPAIIEILDKRIMLDISKTEFIKRRKSDKRWGNEPDWYIEHVWNSNLKFGRINDQNMLLLPSDENMNLALIKDYLKE